MNNYNIREIEKSEYPLLEEFLYEAIFQRFIGNIEGTELEVI
jgi:hypothetical protein